MEQNNQQSQQNQQQNSNTSNNQNPAPAAQAPQQQQKPQPQPQQPKPQGQPIGAGAPAKQSKKNLIISGGVIIVVLAILLVVPHIKKSATTPAATDTGTEETAGTDTKTTTGSKGSVRGTATTQSRAEALATYQGKMITVGDDCSVTPDSQTQATGTTILINNDSATRHRVTVGPKAYTVSGLHYTLSWLNLKPGTLMITCDGKDTKSTITVK